MEIDVRNVQAWTIVRLQGDFISEPDQERFRNRVRELVAKGDRHIVTDLSHVKYINSCGLGSLVCALTVVRKAGGDLALVGAGPEVQSIFAVTQLHKVFDMYPSLADFPFKHTHDLN